MPFGGWVDQGRCHLEVDGQRRKVKLSRSSRKQVEEESMEVGLIKEDALWRLMVRGGR